MPLAPIAPNLAVIPQPPSGISNITAPDLWWIISTVVMMVLVGVVVVFLNRLLDSFDDVGKDIKTLKEEIITLLIQQTKSSQELKDHIQNDGVHCKNTEYCRRSTD